MSVRRRMRSLLNTVLFALAQVTQPLKKSNSVPITHTTAISTHGLPPHIIHAIKNTIPIPANQPHVTCLPSPIFFEPQNFYKGSAATARERHDTHAQRSAHWVELRAQHFSDAQARAPASLENESMQVHLFDVVPVNTEKLVALIHTALARPVCHGCCDHVFVHPGLAVGVAARNNLLLHCESQQPRAVALQRQTPSSFRFVATVFARR